MTTPVFPLVPPSYQVLRGSIYSSPLVRSSCLLSAAVLHALLCLKVYPDVSVERDVLHVHLFHSHLVFTDTGFTKYFSCPFPFKLNILSFLPPISHCFPVARVASSSYQFPNLRGRCVCQSFLPQLNAIEEHTSEDLPHPPTLLCPFYKNMSHICGFC